MRFCLAGAGDHVEDANFVEAQADAGLLRLYAFVEWCREILVDSTGDSPIDASGSDGETRWADRMFRSEMNRLMNETEMHYEKMYFREAMRTGFYEFQKARDNYRELVQNAPDRHLMLRFIEWQLFALCPVTPHLCEYVWRDLLHKEGSITCARWPVTGDIDEGVSAQSEYIQDTAHDLRTRLRTRLQPSPANPKPIKPTRLTLHVADRYPAWQEAVRNALRTMYRDNNKTLPENKAIITKLKEVQVVKPFLKKTMPYVEENIRGKLESMGEHVFDIQPAFDERQLLLDNLDYLYRAADVEEIRIVYSRDSENKKIRDECAPGKAAIVYDSPPAVLIPCVNPQPCSGFFSLDLPIREQDSLPKIQSRLARLLRVKDSSTIQVYRFSDGIVGVRKVPNFDSPLTGKIEICASALFALRDGKVVLTENGSQLEVCHLAYFVR